MLEMIHEYARERLAESGEAKDFQRRHAEYFLALAERAAPELRGAGHARWFTRLRDEHNNLRTALAWSLGDTASGDAEIGLRLVGALRDFWFYEGHSVEGLRWTERALERARSAPPAILAGALNAAGFLCFDQGNYEIANDYYGEALALYRALGDEVGSAWALAFMSSYALAFPSACDEGIAQCKEGLALFRKWDVKPGTVFALNHLGELLRKDGDYEGAARAYEECIAICRETGDRLREALPLGNLSYVAQHQGNYARAEALIIEGLARVWEFESARYIPQALAVLSGPVAARGDPERAARLLVASEALLEAMGVGLQPADQDEVDSYMAAVREELDETTFEAAWAEGRAMSLEQAVAYALGEGG